MVIKNKLQLQADRIVTGLTLLTSRDALYFETGWEPLSDRRNLHRLHTMYKIHNNLGPDYLCDIIPDLCFNASTYTTKNPCVDYKLINHHLYQLQLTNGIHYR